MNLFFGNYAMLTALTALAIPPLIHLLRRRRYQVVEWGAMQFLRMGQNKRRKVWIEELILMLLRMALIALIVLGLAAPFSETSVLAPLAGDQKREFVVLIDGSASMAAQTKSGKSPHRVAIQWVNDFAKTLKPGDRFSVYRVANQSVTPIMEPTRDRKRIAQTMREMPQPNGSADWPSALQSLMASEKKQNAGELRDIVCLTDGQQFGWTNDGKRAIWKSFAEMKRQQTQPKSSRLWMVDVGGTKKRAELPNYTLTPITTSRAVPWVGQTLQFKSKLVFFGTKTPESMPRVYWQLNGKTMGDVQPVTLVDNTLGSVELAFRHKFEQSGSQLISLIVDADPSSDCLENDNKRHYALNVSDHLPVLLIDGDPKPGPTSSTYFIRNALAIASEPDRPPLMATEVYSYLQWQPALADKKRRPSVVVLADVPRLTPVQQNALKKFIADGGGVLVVAGPRAAAGRDHYNRELFDKGNGWLPGRLIDTVRDPISAAFDTTRLSHPALALFQTSQSSTLGAARFPEWWKIAPAKSAKTAAFLTTNDAALIEGKYKNGRVLLCSVPLDRSWNANFTRVFEYPVFLHELIYYLADVRKTDFNVPPGRPLRLPVGESKEESAKLTLPDGDEKTVAVKNETVVWDKTNDAGVYRFALKKKPFYFVAQPDVNESNLAQITTAERKSLQSLVGLQPLKMVSQLHEQRTTEKQDLWWLFFFGVLLFLCVEVWLTRRMAVRGSS